jgi:hypothetical protein
MKKVTCLIIICLIIFVITSRAQDFRYLIQEGLGTVIVNQSPYPIEVFAYNADDASCLMEFHKQTFAYNSVNLFYHDRKKFKIRVKFKTDGSPFEIKPGKAYAYESKLLINKSSISEQDKYENITSPLRLIELNGLSLQDGSSARVPTGREPITLLRNTEGRRLDFFPSGELILYGLDGTERWRSNTKDKGVKWFHFKNGVIYLRGDYDNIEIFYEFAGPSSLTIFYDALQISKNPGAIVWNSDQSSDSFYYKIKPLHRNLNERLK